MSHSESRLHVATEPFCTSDMVVHLMITSGKQYNSYQVVSATQVNILLVSHLIKLLVYFLQILQVGNELLHD